MSGPTPSAALVGLGDLRFPKLSDLWLAASVEQREHWIKEVSARDRLAGHVLRLINARRYTIADLAIRLHHAAFGHPTQREIEQAIHFLQSVELVEWTLGKIVITPPAPVLPPIEVAPAAPPAPQETSLQQLQRSWHQLVNLLVTAIWRGLDTLVWKLDKWLNPQKPEARLPESAAPVAAAAPANVSPLPAGMARIPRRPSLDATPLKPGTLAKHHLRAVSQKIPALRKGKLGDETFLLDQPGKGAMTA